MFDAGIEPHSLGDVDLVAQQMTESDEPEEENVVDLPVHPFHPSQEHENDPAEVVLVSEPESASITMGGLHPRASLYERPVNLDSSKKQHSNFRQVLRSHGIKVLTVRGMLAYRAEKYIEARVQLEDLAMRALTYTLHSSFTLDQLSTEDQFYLTDAYKRQVLEEMSVSQLIDVLLLNPTVELCPSLRDTGLQAKYEYQPLSNLIYTRDQQITTSKGIVMGRLKSSQRQKEVDLLTFCFKKLDIPLLGHVQDPGYLEGGDFFPAGLDLCFIGVGLRSNFEACRQLMEMDWFGTQRVSIVEDKYDQHQDRMHLDCVFSIVGYKVCLMLEDIIGISSPQRRMITEYTQDKSTRKYHQTGIEIEFSEYVQREGYEIIRVTRREQLRYACNVLNLGGSQLISVNGPFSRSMAIEFSSITSMYGAVHCSSQVLKRKGEKEELKEITKGSGTLSLISSGDK